jgi:hypothetical protein
LAAKATENDGKRTGWLAWPLLPTRQLVRGPQGQEVEAGGVEAVEVEAVEVEAVEMEVVEV